MTKIRDIILEVLTPRSRTPTYTIVQRAAAICAQRHSTDENFEVLNVIDELHNLVQEGKVLLLSGGRYRKA
jgi:hypothetical protein